MKSAEEERWIRLSLSDSSDDIYKGLISLLLLVDAKVKTEVDNKSDSLPEY